MIVKICGMTRDVDVAPAIAAGATHLGMIFVEQSPRFIPIDEATILRRVIPAEITVVGVFKDQSVEEVLQTAQQVGLSWVQLHGGFDPSAIAELQSQGLRVIWAAPVSPSGAVSELPANADLLLLDTESRGHFGGSGMSFDWQETKAPSRPFLVAGGLRPHNAVRALDAMPCAGIDLSSGVEAAPGIKSHALLGELGVALRARLTPRPLGSAYTSTEASE